MKNQMWSHVDSDTETWPLSRDRQVTSYLLCDAQGFQSLWKLVLLLEQVGAGAGEGCSVLSYPLWSEDVYPGLSFHMGGVMAASDPVPDPRGQSLESPTV